MRDSWRLMSGYRWRVGVKVDGRGGNRTEMKRS